MKFIKLGSLTLAALVSNACGAESGMQFNESTGEWEATQGEEFEDFAQIDQAVMGGTAVSSGDGAVRVKVTGNGFCSGAIIGPRTIITAAHCIVKTGTGTYNVTATVDYWDADKPWCLTESANTSAKCNTARAGKVWVNPDYATDGGTRSEDFAVIVMDRDFSYVRSAHQMWIMEEPTKAKIGSFTATGYGWNSDADSNKSDVPFSAGFSVDTMKSGYFYSVGTATKALCSGDSGAAQFDFRSSDTTKSMPIVFGVHSGRDVENGSCGEKDTKQYGALVAPYMSKIETVMGRTCRHINYADIGKVADCW